MGKKIFLPIIGILGMVAIVAFQSGFLFILLALLPSVVAWFADSTEDKSVFKTVFACNLAAMLPALYSMINNLINPPNYPVTPPMRQPEVWMVVYLGAAGGWSLVYFCRFCTKMVLTVTYKYRVTSMEAMQKKLAEEWGEDVTGRAPVSSSK